MTVYVFDGEKKLVQPLAESQVTELQHDENNHSLFAVIGAETNLRPGDHLGFTCADGKFRLFTVTTAALDDDKNVIDVTAMDAIVSELQEIIVEDVQKIDVLLQTAIESILPLSEDPLWSAEGTQPDRVEKFRAYYRTAWEMVSTFEQLYEWRIIPWYRFTAGEITGKVMEMQEDEAVFRGRILQSRRDASKVYVTRSGKPITRLYGLGPAQGSGDLQTNMTFEEAEWSTENGDPADKPAGQTWVEDAEAVAKYGVHTARVSITDAKDAADLLQKTWDHLQTVKEPAVTVEAIVADMEMLPGYSWMQIRLGDLVIVELANGRSVEARIIAIKRDYIRPWLTKITVGAKKATIQSQVSTLIASATHTFERLTIYQNRFYEDEALIQLNAEFIQANAEAIEANAKQIRLNAEEILVKADRVELDAYVKATELEADILRVVDDAYIGGILSTMDLYCETLNANSSIATEYLNCYDVSTAGLTVNGTEAVWKEAEVCTGGQVNVTRELSPYFYDSGGTLQTISYVTAATFVPYTTTIKYLGS